MFIDLFEKYVKFLGCIMYTENECENLGTMDAEDVDLSSSLENIKPDNEYAEMYDFKLANAEEAAKLPIYMGSLQTDFGAYKDKVKYAQNFDQEPLKSLRYQVLCPEANYRKIMLEDEPQKGNWTLKKNEAFWAGGIMNGRDFIILVPLKSYQNKVNKMNIDGSIKELLWLVDNGYRFEKIEGKCVATNDGKKQDYADIKDFDAIARADKNDLKPYFEKLCKELNKAFPGCLAAPGSASANGFFSEAQRGANSRTGRGGRVNTATRPVVQRQDATNTADDGFQTRGRKKTTSTSSTASYNYK